MEKNYCLYCMNEVKAGEPCSVCGMTYTTYKPSPHHLAPGTILKNKYLVGRVLGEGGFGITYIACDLTLQCKVAVKEYFPSNIVTRNGAISTQVYRYVTEGESSFERGKQKFLVEARTMARLIHQPEVVRVNDFFEENGTAYIVMEYVDGINFRELVASSKGGRIPADELLKMMKPLFDAIGVIHDAGLIHRDISPDNIMLQGGNVRLLDFGCAREALNGEQTMTIPVKHGFSPMEQYMSAGGQGPWTDVYSFCATLYFCLTGIVPQQALDRNLKDQLVPPTQLGVKLTPAQEQALMHGLAVNPTKRCRSMTELYKGLYDTETPKKENEKKKKTAIIAGIGAAALLLIAGILWGALKPSATQPDPVPVVTEVPTEAPTEAPTEVPTEAPTEAPTAVPTEAPTAVPTEAPTEEPVRMRTSAEIRNVRGVWRVDSDEAQLTKDVVVSAGGTMKLASHVIVEEGRTITVQSGGTLDLGACVLEVRKGGHVVVEEGGCLDTSVTTGAVLCFAQDGLTLKDGAISLLNLSDLNGTTEMLANGFHEDWRRPYAIYMDEEKLFENAVVVTDGQAFAAAMKGNQPIIVRGCVTLHTLAYVSKVPVMVEKNAVFEVVEGKSVRFQTLINHGRITGEARMGNGRDRTFLYNDGTMTRVTDVQGNGIHYPEWRSFVCNQGRMTLDGTLHNVITINTGKLDVGGENESSSIEAGQLIQCGQVIVKARYNAQETGSVIISPGNTTHVRAVSTARLNLMSGEVCQTGTIEVGANGELYMNDLVHNLGTVIVRKDGVLENNGMIACGSKSMLTVESGATVRNHGLIECSLPNGQWDGEAILEGNGRVMPRLSAAESGGEAVTVSTEGELRDALSNPKVTWIALGKPMNLLSDLTVDGKVLYVDQAFRMNGRLTVKGEKGVLINEGYGIICKTLLVTDGAAVLGSGGWTTEKVQVEKKSFAYLREMKEQDNKRYVVQDSGLWMGALNGSDVIVSVVDGTLTAASVSLGAGSKVTLSSNASLVVGDALFGGDSKLSINKGSTLLSTQVGVSDGWISFSGKVENGGVINLRGTPMEVSNSKELRNNGVLRNKGSMLNVSKLYLFNARLVNVGTIAFNAALEQVILMSASEFTNHNGTITTHSDAIAGIGEEEIPGNRPVKVWQ